MATIGDDFNRADGGLGANWTTLLGTPLVVSNHYGTNTTDIFNGAFAKYTGAALATNDHDVTGIVNVQVGQACILYTRMLSGTDGTQGYGFEVRGHASGLLVSFTRLPNDAGIYVLFEQQSGITSAGDHTLRMTIVGNTMKIYLDGILQTSQLHTSYPTGTYVLLGCEHLASWIDSFTATDYVDPWPEVKYVGTGVFAVGVTSSGNVLGAFPAGYTAVTNDTGILCVQGLHNTGSSLAPTAPSGWTQIATQFQNIGTYDLQITLYRRTLVSGDAAPNVVCPAAYSTSSGGMSVYMMVFRNAHPVVVEDATAVVSSGAAAASFAPTGITTVTRGAMVVSAVASGDDNALGLLSGSVQGFSLKAGNLIDASNYDTTTGGDHAMGAAIKPVDTAGAVTCPTWSETLVGNDAWAAITIALRPWLVSRPGVFVRQAVKRAAVR